MTRSGSTLVESLVAMALGLFLVHLGLRATADLRRTQDLLERRGDLVESARVARHVLRRELAHLDSIDALSSDSMSIRAVRALMLPCAATLDERELLVSYRGNRLPDTTKDSVEVIYADGDVVRAGLVASGVSTRPCPTANSDERVLLMSLDPLPPPGFVLARVYERGSYHLTGGALRYRRGRSGRQPLTPEVWSDVGSGWDGDGGRLVMTLTPADTLLINTWNGLLGWYPH